MADMSKRHRIVPADSVGIPGCIIYAPWGEALEYAPLATSPYRGCGHCCAYCYVPSIAHMTREEFDSGAVERKDYLKVLRRDARKYQKAGITEPQVLLSFMTDVYHDGDTALTRATLECLIEHDLSYCVLSKGGTRALRDLHLFRPDRDSYACTLTCLDDDAARKWERKAPPPSNRIMALKRFHDAGIFTWVSLEPTLDIENSLAVVRATHKFVDLYKVGRANRLDNITRTTDWADYTHRMVDLLNRVGAQHYIKLDLQIYLQPGYRNPMRVAQHH